jgi:hypothetical protein
MPAVRTSSNSTTHRINLGDFIDAFGDTMVFAKFIFALEDVMTVIA